MNKTKKNKVKISSKLIKEWEELPNNEGRGRKLSITEEERELLKMFYANKMKESIAKKLGMSKTSLMKIASEMGLSNKVPNLNR